MNSPRKFLLATIFALATVSFSSASNIYVAQNTAGGDTGADCADAHSAAWFNSPSNWGSGSHPIGPGTTVHLCGTFTGAAGSTMLTTQGNGASGNPVTVLFESGALLTSPSWGASDGSTGAITVSNSYITIDGGANGTITNTDVGTQLTYHQTTYLIVANVASNLEIKNLSFPNIYMRQQNSTDHTYSAAVLAQDGSNVLIHDNSADHCARCYMFVYSQSPSNVQFYNNTLSFAEHGITVGSGNSSGTISGVLIHDNTLNGGAYIWDSPDNSWHHDPIHVWAMSAGNNVNGLQIYNNSFSGSWAQVTTTCHNSYIFVETNLTSPTVFNNVMTIPASGAIFPCNGFIFFKYNLGTGSVYNNTIVGLNTGNHPGTAITCASATINSENNVIEYMTEYYACGYGTVDNNTYYLADPTGYDGHSF